MAELIDQSLPVGRVNGDAEPESWPPISFEDLANAQHIAPVKDINEWIQSLPDIEGTDDLADNIEMARMERRRLERKTA